jgi:hypothetical protein
MATPGNVDIQLSFTVTTTVSPPMLHSSKRNLTKVQRAVKKMLRAQIAKQLFCMCFYNSNIPNE